MAASVNTLTSGPEITYAIIIVLLPLCAYFIQCVCGKRLPRMGDWLSTGAIFGSFLFACRIFYSMLSAYDSHWLVAKHWRWIDLSSVSNKVVVDIGIRIDPVSATMLLMVTLCATLIHLFSTAYMRDSKGVPEDGYRYASFFSYLSLFTAAMLGLIISDNLLTLFMCWELMGLCSYLLIGFYRHKISAANASIKAFMTTRIGDTALFIGMLAIFTIVGSFRFEDIYAAIDMGAFNGVLLGVSASFLIGFLVFCGTVGKSAQFPLQVWLPDAMEGPTPVSALIHAATMVAAGVYLILRMFPLLLAGNVLAVVAYVGATTALLAAILAIKQNDIKKVLAYSTLSQLGYMVLAVGVGAWSAAFLHLLTHAIFKACLFMGSGSVIHAMHHEQDMNNMGGLRKKLPKTFISMFIATLAISGVPLFSGFVSKDAILAGTLGNSLHHGGDWYLVFAAFTTAGLTAFYMFRLIFKTFFGKPKDEHAYDHAHEGGWNMTTPLLVLAGLSLWFFYGSQPVPGFTWYKDLIHAPIINDSAKEFMEHFHHYEHVAHMPTVFLSILLAGLGILFSYLFFISKKLDVNKFEKRVPRVFHRWIDNLYFFDFFYIKVLIKKIFLPTAEVATTVDNSFIDKIAVDGWGKVTMAVKEVSKSCDDIIVDKFLVDQVAGGVPRGLGSFFRVIQNGKIQRYLTVAIMIIVIVFMVKFFNKGAL